MGIRDHQLHAFQPALRQALQERGPEGLSLGGADVQADDFALAVRVHRHGDYGGDRDDAAALALLEVGGIEPEIRPIAGERAVQEGIHPFIDLLAELGDLGFADPGEPHRLHQVFHPAGGDAANPGFLDHGDERLFRTLPRFEEGREITPLPQFRDAQLQRAEPGVEGALAIAVAPRRALAAALEAAGADQPLHVGLHQQLQHGLGHGAQEIPFAGLLQQLGQRHSFVGHRSSRLG
jgi:hypothetical protein